MSNHPDLTREKALGGRVAGIDEAGCGPLAGPVIAAACVLDPERLPQDLLNKLRDSKQISAYVRENLAASLWHYRREGAVDAAVMGASTDEIFAINIRKATHLAMIRAIRKLTVVPDHLLIDGNSMPNGLTIPAVTVVNGDALCCSIAAASILAKTMRDRIMAKLARRYPAYGWEQNAGYGTKKHRVMIAESGITPHHRLGFKLT